MPHSRFERAKHDVKCTGSLNTILHQHSRNALIESYYCYIKTVYNDNDVDVELAHASIALKEHEGICYYQKLF